MFFACGAVIAIPVLNNRAALSGRTAPPSVRSAKATTKIYRPWEGIEGQWCYRAKW